MEGCYNEHDLEYVGTCDSYARIDNKRIIFRQVSHLKHLYNSNEYTRKFLQTRGRTIHVPRRGAWSCGHLPLWWLLLLWERPPSEPVCTGSNSMSLLPLRKKRAGAMLRLASRGQPKCYLQTRERMTPASFTNTNLTNKTNNSWSVKRRKRRARWIRAIRVRKKINSTSGSWYNEDKNNKNTTHDGCGLRPFVLSFWLYA